MNKYAGQDYVISKTKEETCHPSQLLSEAECKRAVGYINERKGEYLIVTNA